ncbi:CD3324 family protein [Paenibacillus sp. FSL R10-2734]|uniref:CD3324 family protein n=1 Tax=Paenibacillus sp. FSL R10-2734 TaxID=2954691 RepID=UPI0030DA05CC
MKYVNADTIFPKELLEEIQKYINGGMVYIPKPEESHVKWGEKSGSRKYLRTRNIEICLRFAVGATVDQLSDEYCLSRDSIRKSCIPKNSYKPKAASEEALRGFF